MKNVVLIGDSIRMGYDKAVKKTLEGAANVWYPEENCRFSVYVLRALTDWASQCKFDKVDVVHWNAGLWDSLRQYGEDPIVPLEFYPYYIDRICQRMKKLFPDAKFIFATSTAVQTDKMDASNFIRYNDEIEEYNKAAIEVVKKYGMEVNDLFAVSRTLPEEAHSDTVHYYTPMGTKAFADSTLKYLANALEISEIPEYKEEMYTDKPIGF